MFWEWYLAVQLGDPGGLWEPSLASPGQSAHGPCFQPGLPPFQLPEPLWACLLPLSWPLDTRGWGRGSSVANVIADIAPLMVILDRMLELLACHTTFLWSSRSLDMQRHCEQPPVLSRLLGLMHYDSRLVYIYATRKKANKWVAFTRPCTPCRKL